MRTSSTIYNEEEKWEITKRFRDISPEEKELFLKGVIKDLEKAKEDAKENLKDSPTNRSKRVVTGVIGGFLGSTVAGIGAMIAGKILGAPMEFIAVSSVPFVIGSAGSLAGVLVSPLVRYSDGIEKGNKRKIKKADEGIKNAKEELKKIGSKGR